MPFKEAKWTHAFYKRHSTLTDTDEALMFFEATEGVLNELNDAMKRTRTR